MHKNGHEEKCRTGVAPVSNFPFRLSGRIQLETGVTPVLRPGNDVALPAAFGDLQHQQTMALINCPECGRQVSTAASACPGCGFPVAEKVARSGSAANPSAAPASNQLLAEVRSSWWRYFWHLVFFWLIVPLFVAWYRRASVVLRVFPNRITLERGVFSKCYQDYLPRDIRSIDIDQSFLGRLVGIGDVTISTAATAEGSEKIEGIPDPKGLRELILAQRGDH